MAERMDTCPSCVFFNRRPGHPYGQCRRHSPKVAEREHRIEKLWPVVTDDDWCGDFEARRAAT